MEILKGQVRDPGYPDCECTYAKMDNGQLYYFIKDGELSNQNIIVTTILKEAIGHTPYTSLGLINSNGDVLIPFENKAITKLDDNLLLVEKNAATTQSVIDAINAKSDPFSATNLVNTANAIKEQMKSVMGYSAEFVFDNQFSEAALYNIQGQNIGGAYFSFIGRDDFGNYYMSSNVLNSQIVKYDPSLVQNQAPPTASTEAPSSSDDVQQQISEAPQDNQISDNTQNNNETFNNVQEETPNQDQQNAPDLGIPNIDIPIQNQVSDNQEQVNNVENQNFETGNNVGDNPDIPLSNGDSETTPENNTSDMVSDAGESENNSISQEVDNVSNVSTNNDSNDFGIGDSNNVDDTTVDDNESDDDTDIEDSDNADDATVDDNESDVDSGTEDSDDVDDATVDDNESDDDTDTEDNANVDDTTVVDNESDDDSDTEDSDNVDDATVDDNESDVDSDTEDSDNVDDATVDDNESNDDTDTEDNDNVDDTTVDDNESDDDSDTEDSDNVDAATVDDNESDDDTDTEDNDNVDDTTVDDNESDADSDTGNDDENVSNAEEANMDLVDEDITNPVIFNATNTIRKLLDENRSQREVIDHQADELENIKSSNEILLADNNSKEQELRSLRKSMSHFRGQNSSLTRENTKLKSINDRQKEVIENLKHQNQVLKEQVAGISALGSAVAEANTVIGIDDNSSDDSITYDTDLGYLGDSDEVEDK